MCYALIEVTYRAANPPNDILEASDETALEQRLATLQNNGQIERIRVFSLSRTLTRTTTWSET